MKDHIKKPSGDFFFFPTRAVMQEASCFTHADVLEIPLSGRSWVINYLTAVKWCLTTEE